MRRTAILTITMLALTSFMATTVRAQSPHFINASASGPDEFGNLLVKFKIAGLGDTVTTTVTATADATATYVCQNNGGNCPNAANKITVSGPVSKSGQFTSGKNGSIADNLTLNPPLPGTNFSCPGGQDLKLAKVSYTNVQVSQAAAGTQSIPGTFAKNDFFPPGSDCFVP